MEQALKDLSALVGTEIGVSGWMEINQDRIDAFAEATNDHQFIHVNPELAGQTLFGGHDRSWLLDPCVGGSPRRRGRDADR